MTPVQLPNADDGRWRRTGHARRARLTPCAAVWQARSHDVLEVTTAPGLIQDRARRQTDCRPHLSRPVMQKDETGPGSAAVFSYWPQWRRVLYILHEA
jgi:hypothetical protein